MLVERCFTCVTRRTRKARVKTANAKSNSGPKFNIVKRGLCIFNYTFRISISSRGCFAVYQFCWLVMVSSLIFHRSCCARWWMRTRHLITNTFVLHWLCKCCFLAKFPCGRPSERGSARTENVNFGQKVVFVSPNFSLSRDNFIWTGLRAIQRI